MDEVIKKYSDEIKNKLDEVGLKIPEILLPSKKCDFAKFSCIATDQFTQDIAYWESVKEYIGDSPSIYNLIYPEAYYLEDLKKYGDDFDNQLNKKLVEINNNMQNYICNNIYENVGNCFVYVKRNTSSGIRKGLVVAIDLEKYDYNVGAKSLIRATELTVKDRLIVRKKIREKATLDIPHILLLINDKNNNLFNTIDDINEKRNLNVLYDFDLMKDSGHIVGYKIKEENDINNILDVIIKLKNDANDGLLYAVGDGNHSLASAKDCYEKTGRGRYALVEIVNLYDEGLDFYPIHRLLINADRNDFINKTGVDINNPPPLQDLQKILDDYIRKTNENIIEKDKKIQLEYIHGKEECLLLGKLKNNIAIVYDEFSRGTLFDDVIKNGSLCRKSFSMGIATDKRFYLEGMKIV